MSFFFAVMLFKSSWFVKHLFEPRERMCCVYSSLKEVEMIKHLTLSLFHRSQRSAPDQT